MGKGSQGGRWQHSNSLGWLQERKKPLFCGFRTLKRGMGERGTGRELGRVGDWGQHSRRENPENPLALGLGFEPKSSGLAAVLFVS